MASAAAPLNYLLTLYQRYDSLRNSIALLREQTLNTPGIEDWYTHYSNLLSHTFSIASALQSATPHFLAAQIATLNEFLEAEALDANLFGDEPSAGGASSLLYGSGSMSGLPPVHDTDKDNTLNVLAVHPSLPIPDSKLNWLGTLLRTVPEIEVSAEEARMVAIYDKKRPEYDEEALSMQIRAHDEKSLRALRSWYHLLHAPDSAGDTYDFATRIVDEE
ncbi:hypothetical protein MVES_000417 [Malassezia vespertilionis]|uniref:Uncharacterized protein n=1 Tax=Malassezia vespertilionis TaxID=2020962 RepID=A0A2N1JHJ8_9BASI|nr:hypothetical protein MVES_000417 [Malassezia vespertilionis]